MNAKQLIEGIVEGHDMSKAEQLIDRMLHEDETPPADIVRVAKDSKLQYDGESVVDGFIFTPVSTPKSVDAKRFIDYVKSKGWRVSNHLDSSPGSWRPCIVIMK